MLGGSGFAAIMRWKGWRSYCKYWKFGFLFAESFGNRWILASLAIDCALPNGNQPVVTSHKKAKESAQGVRKQQVKFWQGMSERQLLR